MGLFGNRKIILAITLIITQLFQNQVFSQGNNYPQGYFMFPIMPGQINSLSGCFGDLRTNHFHAGIDIRTNGSEGLNVYAAADGYVSRIGIKAGGYGNALYITHPNGYTTLYGHLLKYSEKIEQYLRQKQYEQQKWDVEININPNELIVSKGEVVALSGNTGASGGPHLHFEIRDAAENAINPMLFGFYEVQDIQSPVIDKVILRTLSKDARINGHYGRFSFSPTRNADGSLSINTPIQTRGEIGLELLAYDRSNTSPFRLGLSSIDVQLDNNLLYNLVLDKMPFDISKDINVHIDYALVETNGQKIQKCYIDDGNRLNIYKTNRNKGKIVIRDNQLHNVSIKGLDTYRNETNVYFTLQGVETVVENLPQTSAASTTMTTTIEDNLLIIRARKVNNENPVAILQFKGVPKVIPLEYYEEGEAVFIYDLTNGLADFVQVDNASKALNLKAMVAPQGNQIYKEDNIRVNFSNALYDTLFLTTAVNGNKFSVATEKTPLKDYIEIGYRPNVFFDAEKTKAYYTNDRRKYLGGEWSNNHITFKTKELGDYELMTDNAAPSIRPITINENDLRFAISDNLSGINEIRCEVNGQWVLMDYEYKSGRIWAEKLNDLEPFIGDLLLKVTDNCNNQAIFECNIQEYIAAKEYEAQKRRQSTKHRSTKSKSRKRKAS